MSVVTKNTEAVLHQFAQRVIKAAKLNLGATRTITYNDGKKKRRRQVSSGRLKNSLDYDLLTGVHLLMSFTMEDYGVYIDEGVDGVKHKVKGGTRFGFKSKYPNMGAIKQMVSAPKFKVRDYKTNKFIKKDEKSINQATFLISRAIYNRGIPKSEFFQAPFRLEYQKLPEEVLKAVSMDVDEFMKFAVRGK